MAEGTEGAQGAAQAAQGAEGTQDPGKGDGAQGKTCGRAIRSQ